MAVQGGKGNHFLFGASPFMVRFLVGDVCAKAFLALQVHTEGTISVLPAEGLRCSMVGVYPLGRIRLDGIHQATDREVAGQGNVEMDMIAGTTSTDQLPSLVSDNSGYVGIQGWLPSLFDDRQATSC